MKVFIVLAACAAFVSGQDGKVREPRGLAAGSFAAGPAQVGYGGYPQFAAFGGQAFGPATFGFANAQAPYAAYPAPAYAAGPAYASAPVAAAAVQAPVAVSEAYKSAGPQTYAQQVPAAAIRNVETVGVTKTITPVVTKTTTYNTHSEPALSVGHVQGYSQSAHGPGKVAPVHYNTVYTQYLNPTVGVNGPVTYAGPAVGQGIGVQQGVAAVAVPAPVAYAPQQFLAAAPQYFAAAPQYLAAGPGPVFGHAAHGHAHGPPQQFFAAGPAALPPPNTYGPPTNAYIPPSNTYGPPSGSKY